ncbi:O-methyltransferase family 3 [Penicillium paradoxum]|uniref:O-methyltransferase family 3 n=1 Tax=Penicillium paradoxum TaxID=176176 RepID=UPI002549C061|nr:O-methyltransferase family 3 [Penicillium paradoxum]KAJ5794640.1 O-methyltransferase family 3 [Penicillium paradoxum]
MSIQSAKGPITSGILFPIFWHILRLCLSFSLLPVNNTILAVAVFLSYLRSVTTRWRATPRNVRFYPKTVLITGIGTAHGLALARSWATEGHRVVGADVTDLDLPVRSGGSMSKALVAFYRIRKDHYISRLLDTIHREKVDLWIPCSPKATSIEDATARQVIESRTNCKCITFDSELAACFANPDSFRHYVTERSLPVLEKHNVQSRDSVHKILHRSPSKTYQMSRATSSANEKAMFLPRRTMSKTYNMVSEIQISQNRPWVLQQQFRLGELFADLLVVHGDVQAVQVRLSDSCSSAWGASRLDEALATAVHRLMQKFAGKGGIRFTGHLSVRLMVDEEFDSHSVRHTIYIAGCTSGARAVNNMLRNAPCPIAGYLSIFPSHPVDTASITATMSPIRPVPISTRGDILPAAFLQFPVVRFLLAALDVIQAELLKVLFWKDPLFSVLDPLPWWWQVHVYQPLREIWVWMKQAREAGLSK